MIAAAPNGAAAIIHVFSKAARLGLRFAFLLPPVLLRMAPPKGHKKTPEHVPVFKRCRPGAEKGI